MVYTWQWELENQLYIKLCYKNLCTVLCFGQVLVNSIQTYQFNFTGQINFGYSSLWFPGTDKGLI